MEGNESVTGTPALDEWLRRATGATGPFHLQPLAGGNSNETLLVRNNRHEWVLRRPPKLSIAAGANNLAREHRVISVLHAHGVRVPQPIAFHSDDNEIGRAHV